MKKNELIDEYFDWMYQLVCDEEYAMRISYRRLFRYLYDTTFLYIVDMDANRADDGRNLRYRFGYERGYYDTDIHDCLDDKPCSFLEMLLALSLRCEETIMADPEHGNRTRVWFWDMLSNSGLAAMTDARFSKPQAHKIVDRLLNREYDKDGSGGLFIIKRCKHDLRTVEIWYQLCWYLDAIL